MAEDSKLLGALWLDGRDAMQTIREANEADIAADEILIYYFK